jgi:hypothetical protein
MARRWPVRGGLATCNGNAGCGGLGSMLAGCGLGVGALWACSGELTPVGIVQRGRGKERGGPGCFLPVFHVSRPGSGQGRLGLDRGEVHGYGYRVRAHEIGVIRSRVDFPGFRPPSVRSNARKNSNFAFFEKFHFGLSTY